MHTAPPVALWLFLIITVSASVYYAAVASGIYKDPMMAQFRRYGEERQVYPLCRFLYVAGGVALVMGLLLPSSLAPQNYLRRVFPPVFFFTLAFLVWGAAFLIYRQPGLREALPRWYFYLLRHASRQERRQLGFAWLRIPRRMRWHLNGDQKAFEVWVELMRLTVIYGAYDPTSPWHVWE